MIRTLIVDDDSLIHVTLRSLIDWEDCGYTVVQDCSGGNQALGYLMEHPVDLLITDIKMPGMDGLELVRQVRRAQDRVTVRTRTPSRYELYYRVRSRNGAQDTVRSIVRQIQGLWHDLMNLDTAVGISSVVSRRELEEAAACCETLCKLSVLQGPGSLCVQGQYGELVRAYNSQAPACDGLIAALCGEDQRLMDQELGRWLSGLKRLDNKDHIRQILILLARLGERLESYGLSFSRVFPERPDFPALLRDFESKREREIWLRNTLRRVRDTCDSQRQERQKGAIQ